MLRLMPQPVKYRGTVTGLRISAVDGGATESGGAFIDAANSSITDLADGLHQIEIYDSAGRMIRGVLKAAGSAETTNEELTNTGFETGDPPTGWLTQGTPTLSQVADERTGGAGTKSLNVAAAAAYDAARQALVADKRLYKYGGWVKAGATYAGAIGIYGVANNTSANTSWAYIGPFYATNVSYTNGIQLSGTTVGSSARFDDVTCAQVLAPSSAGATIVSAKAGTTWNFGYKNASFTYNAASYYAIVRKLR